MAVHRRETHRGPVLVHVPLDGGVRDEMQRLHIVSARVGNHCVYQQRPDPASAIRRPHDDVAEPQVTVPSLDFVVVEEGCTAECSTVVDRDDGERNGSGCSHFVHRLLDGPCGVVAAEGVDE